MDLALNKIRFNFVLYFDGSSAPRHILFTLPKKLKKTNDNELNTLFYDLTLSVRPNWVRWRTWKVSAVTFLKLHLIHLMKLRKISVRT